MNIIPFSRLGDRGFSDSGRFVSGVQARCTSLLHKTCFVLLLLAVPAALWAADPAPSKTSKVGDSVTNPVTGLSTKVTAVVVDPAGTPTAGTTAFVQTLDGYSILVKALTEKIYNNDSPPLGFTILSQDTTAKTVTLDADPVGGPTATLAYQGTTANFQAQFGVAPAGPTVTAPISVAGAGGVRVVLTGTGGSNGQPGALFVPPGSGGNGAVGPAASYTSSFNISTINQIGIEVGSVGGSGGNGGSSYLSFWSGRDGGNGGAGGPVTVVNSTGIQVATTGANAFGIFGYSRSGQAGSGGTGFAAPGGGTGGHSSDGGTVSITNHGTVITSGSGAFGIYGLSVSNNGGNGGGQWGLVGQSGSGGFGGSGGSVSITNGRDGIISTSGNLAHGIFAQSIGGSGGSSGTSGNLILSLQGASDNGGNGGAVSVTNNGTILTTGDNSRGIFAQSIGGGGGAGGSSGGLIALGGSGSNGGSGSTVSVINGSRAIISTAGLRSDGIFAQSVGGSGGSGSDAGGLIAVGGGGSKAGDGGAVTVENFGTISTTRNFARGIVAQSIGGGGGDGGSSGGMVSVGGSGAGGGVSSTVTVTNGGDIITLGNDAKGILAQSVGGGGGNGGSSGSVGLFAGVAVGGTAGGGGAGGDVNITLQGKNANTASLISTGGARSTGLFAQSVGGGGGSGGGAVQVAVGAGAAISIAVGGQGGAGGAGGTVTLSKGTGGISIIETNGNDSAGAMIQSVGGGGGNGGYSVAAAASGGPVSGALSVAVGGKGATGGAGGTVEVGTFDIFGNMSSVGFNGSIFTSGERSTGFLAQSVGGGGGNGGLAVAASASTGLLGSISVAVGVGGSGAGGGEGGQVSVGYQGNITTEKSNSTGLLVQSVGGGGGNGGGSIAASLSGTPGIGAAISVGVGGSAGAGSVGGEVSVATRAGTVTTKGDNSTGIIVQSIGGGGGNGGYNVSAGLAGGDIAAASINVGLGGTAGGGGNGGSVRADLRSDVLTSSVFIPEFIDPATGQIVPAHFGHNSGGILVQSVGGGGGNGGFNISAGAALGGAGSAAVSVGLGGAGGSGGTGGTVSASSTGILWTQGNNSSGFIAQSIGGGGGNGGYNVSAGVAGAGVAAGAIGVGLGGTAGSGNNAGVVTATTSVGKITTFGHDSLGVLAQSVGGGGGNGGFNVSGVGSGSLGVGGAIAVGLGGSGGAGGTGGSVTLTVNNDVSTSGKNSSAVVAQSIGGGGGSGGFNVSGTISGGGGGNASVSIGLGGAGLGGGNGGVVNATVNGNIDTLLESSIGILAQSVGGGGGNGGFNVSGGLAVGGAGTGAVTIGLGGSGGIAGNGGQDGIDRAVTLTTSGSVITMGSHSTGIVAQSLGGGGGNGGFNVSASLARGGGGGGAISVGLGGSGGTGGIGKDVYARLQSSVTTSSVLLDASVDPLTGAIIPMHYATDSTGILVQSVGGGGGNGGFNVSGSLSGAGIGGAGISVGLGGNGGSGGLGGDVDAASTGQIVTHGDRSSGFVIQSLGGGGGNGGFNVSGSLSGGATGTAAISVGLGGNGGTGNHSGEVLALSSGNVWTYGKQATGILAQSVGGGGGHGGFNVSGGLSFGGGSGGIAVGLGGSGGSAGNAGLVNLTVNNTVYTEGNQSVGVIGQSIGGGGGNGGYNVTAIASGGGSGSGTVGVGLGGSGGGGGDAGAVTVSTTGNIETKGQKSGGILAQSVGGGGGNGSYNVTVSGSGAGTGSGAVAVGLGGSGAGGGNASTVDLTVRNSVTTTLSDSSGIIAQSVGGGGGNGAFDVTVAGSGAGTGSGALSVSLGGSAGTGGYADRVTSDVIGNIQTGGDNSLGFLTQSVGGGGGNGGFSVSAAISGAGKGSAAGAISLGGSGGDGGHGGVVISSYAGNIITSGKNSTGIVYQSLGGGGGTGGFSVAGTFSAAKTGSFAAAFGIGGSGGSGNYADTVNNTVVGTIVTSSVLIPAGIDPVTGLFVPAHYAENSGGILAQSLGGGGGNGGFNVSGAISLAQTGSGALSIGIGGSGGDGGYSQKVTNNVTGDVFTSGNFGFGIAAQSIGGGGGNGGMNITGAIAAAKDGSGALGIGIGGFGGGGGDAGEVDNTVTGYVQTLGDNAIGILAQSLGGGGGNGGMNITGVITAAKTASGNVGFGIGGFGGDGGDGQVVLNLVNGGTVTIGDNSQAIVAQSLGGGGGNGALNVTGTFNFTEGNGGTLGIGIGGFGGKGGHAGDVTSIIKTTATNNQIATSGDQSSAVVAQSIGGGGGGGALNVTGAINITGKNGAAIGVGIGGFGGGAGNAGVVTVDVDGDITTRGHQSHGLLAQSIGGAGGNGGTNVTGTLAFTGANGGTGTTIAASIGVGGFGGGGGTAGAVDVKYNGTISALPGVYYPAVINPVSGVITPGYFELNEGEGSHGLVAQSIGGGGGNGGLNVSAGISYARGGGDGYGIMIGVGGFGGLGGSADKVDVLVTGGESITAYGAGHSALLAQSIGGAGGNGATNISGGIVSDSPLIVGVGGFGGNAGVSKDVTVTSTTDLFALAADAKNFSSAGLMAQSLGGGGGNGGLNVSGGLAISKESSVPSITIGVGGFGGAGSISGNVSVNHTGNILTSGAWIHGIMAQSIAGGGGNGGMNVSSQINFADSDNSGGKTDLTVVAGIGGNAGKGADAGNVSITHNGAVTTSDDNARGVAAQSIGGGGGNGGMNIGGVFAKNSSPIIVGVGGSGSGGGHAGSATVIRGSNLVSTGKITTDGNGAYGIEASSIGGGGGDAGMNFNAGVTLAGKDGTDAGFAANFAIGGAGGEAGNGAAASVNNFSDIETMKDNSHGIISQSIGGGGGNANFNVAVTYAGSSGGGALYNKPNKNLGFNLALGGAPGDGGFGGTSDVMQIGNIETWGQESYGILSQSIGGGGGNAGLDFAFVKADGGKAGLTIGRVGGLGGYASDITLFSNGSVTTHGERSFGMLAQSVGNGGGNSSSTTIAAEIPSEESNTGEVKPHAIGLSIGLEGGIGGHAGNVDLDAIGFVTTSGNNAHAIFAQSVGGGGGNGGSANTFGITAATASMSLGGAGGQGGYGGIVDVDSSAQVRTTGDNSVGILAQSVGGGGGNGGMASSGGTKNGDSGISVSIGGGGGIGMTGGLVTVENSGIIITGGEGSHGVLAQSLGGGGGNGGMAINTILKASTEDSTRASLAIGGSGGEGAAGGDVILTNTGGIGTTKEGAIGLFAQSIGGGGGNGRSVINNSIASTSGNNFSLNIGGTGGKGATGGSVSVSNLVTADPDSGKIITLENFAHGIVAMSIGGGGGNGSTVVNVNRPQLSQKASSAGNLSFSLGGSGGEGGTGGHVQVLNAGSITTYGFKAHGILAQSIGGGGGNGGTTFSGDFALGTKTNPASGKVGLFSIGGFGGDGNRSGDVVVTNAGSIEVFGDKSDGIFAQSVGGGGGDGGFAMALSKNSFKNPKTDLAASLMTMALGGLGGTGADSGNVTVNHTGSIISHGADSYGIFAQSVGGGGGNAAHSISSPAWTAADLAFVTLLGGGSSGKAGLVTINTTGSITMLGDNSTAQFGQSVNGGGGNVELFLDVSQHAVAIGDDGIELPDNGGDVDKVRAFVNSNIKLGTDAISDAVGSAIDATQIGDLYTQGRNSISSLIQSIGGGGGNAQQEIVVDTHATVNLELALGGTSSSNNRGGDLTLSRQGDVGTMGAQSPNVLTQSIGGGGGNLTINAIKVAAPFTLAPGPLTPGVTATATLGANNGTASDGGTLDLIYNGNLNSIGARANGVIAQSIGGGGGKLDLSGVNNAQIDIGGTNGSSGDGGDVTLTNIGQIATQGNLSHGMIIQSIGGGGGLAMTDQAAKISLGGRNGTTGNGGDIKLTNTGSMLTEGVLAHAVMLQTIGGGGGAAFTDLDPSSIAFTLNPANSGDGGNITFVQTGSILLTGERSIGIFAQSLGGGGGAVDRLFADTAGGAGTSGAITIGVDGDILANGPQATGIVAQSKAANGQGNISITLATGRTISAGSTGVSVMFSGGAENLFTNRGTLGEAAKPATAVLGELGNETVDNFALINGSVDLGGGKNTFNHHTGALLRSGAVINLGMSGTFNNAGTISAGGREVLQTTALTGNYVQTGDVIWEVDLGSGLASDRLDISGVGQLGAFVNTIDLNQLGAFSEPGTYTLITAQSGLTGTFQLRTFTGAMPTGLTYELLNSPTTELLELTLSTGSFYWQGAVDGMWNTSFQNGQSNWSRGGTGEPFILGTPGADSDVFFVGDNGAINRGTTTLGADFVIRSLNFYDDQPITIASDGNTLTLAAGLGVGLTVGRNAGLVTISADLILGASQTWFNESNQGLDVNAATISASGQNLVIDGSGLTMISSNIQTGNGGLTKDGSGKLILLGQSTYRGSTTINDGILELDGFIASENTIVNLEGLLQGTGRMGGNLLNRGLVSPGHSPGALHVHGNYRQTNEGTLRIEIASLSTSDHLEIGGEAKLGGDLDVVLLDGFRPERGDKVTFLTADNEVLGRFDDVNAPVWDLLTLRAFYFDDSVKLKVVINSFAALPGLTENQHAVAMALDRAIPNLDAENFIHYLYKRDFSKLPADFDKIAPEELTSVFTVVTSLANVQSLNIERRTADLRRGDSGFNSQRFSMTGGGPTYSSSLGSQGPLGAPRVDGSKDSSSVLVSAPENRWGVFLSGTGEWTRLRDTENARGYDLTSGGLTLGIDYKVSKNLAVGLSFGYTGTTADLTEGGSVGVNGGRIGAYATTFIDGWYADAAVSAGRNSYDSRRTALQGTARGDFDGDELTLGLGTGYYWKVGALTIGPTAAFNYTHVAADGFTERGSLVPLEIREQSQESIRTTIGLKASYDWKIGRVLLRPEARAAWQHEYGDRVYSLDASFAQGGGSPFTASGPVTGRDSALLSAGFAVQLSERWSTSFFYDTVIGRTNYDSQSITGGMSVNF
jgi:uncharacterized protein YhjY with autotransporter beta-barrel domain